MHINAIDGAGLDAEFAAGALVDYDCMHLLCRAKNGIDRACLNALCTANTDFFVDPRDSFGFFRAVFRVEWLRLAIEKIGKCHDSGFSPWRALIDIGFIFGNGRCIGAAAGKTALSALGLRQQRVDLVDDWVTFNFEILCCESK